MSTELVETNTEAPAELAQLNNAPASTAIDVFDEYAKASDYFLRLELKGATSKLCQSGKIGIGHFALVTRKDDFVDLTKSVDVLVLSYRLKALQIIGDKYFNYYNPQNPEFQRVRGLSTIQDSGCLCGPEFLLYIPSVKSYATLLMNSKTAKTEAMRMKPFVNKALTLKGEVFSNAKNTWQGIKSYPCSVAFELPPLSKINAMVEKFNTAPDSQEKVAPVSATPERER